MAARFQLTPAAEDQIGDIVEFIAQDSEDAAVRVRNALYAAFELLASTPGIGHWRQDLTEQPYKFWPVFSYHVMYDPESTPLKIIAVIHGARDVARLLKEDPSWLRKMTARSTKKAATPAREAPVLSPPLKWAGGKRWQVPHLEPLWRPHAERGLVEPFAGGLAVALGLSPARAILNDINPHRSARSADGYSSLRVK